MFINKSEKVIIFFAIVISSAFTETFIKYFISISRFLDLTLFLYQE